jgi:hypothetical protein
VSLISTPASNSAASLASEAAKGVRCLNHRPFPAGLHGFHGRARAAGRPRDAGNHGGALALVAPQPVVARLLSLVGADQLIPVYDSLDAALAAAG